MILGIGVDVCAIDRIRDACARPGFVDRVFTLAEQRGSEQTLAGRFAAKEAFVKAFSGARPGQAPVAPDMDWRDVEVVADGWGRPVLTLHGALADAVEGSLGEIVAHVSITHEPTMAAAVVVIEEKQR